MKLRLALVALLLLCVAAAAAVAASLQQQQQQQHQKQQQARQLEIDPAVDGQAWQWGVYGVTVFTTLLAAAGGVGANGMLVTLYTMASGGRLSPGQALGLLSCVFAGTACVHVAYYAPQRHPLEPGRALVDPNLLLLLMAPTVLGTTIGALILWATPAWIVYVVLVVILLASCYSLTSKAAAAHAAYRQQQRAAAAAAAAAACRAAADSAEAGGDSKDAAAALVSRSASGSSLVRSRSLDLLRALRAGNRHGSPLSSWRPQHLLLLLLVMAAAALPSLAALAACGSPAWFAALLSGVPVCLGALACLVAWLWLHIRASAAAMGELALPPGLDGCAAAGSLQQQWTLRRLVLVPTGFLLSGIAHGFCGGSAAVTAHLLLTINTHPAVLAGTMQVSLLGYAAAGIATFGAIGLPWRLGGVVTAIAVTCTAGGHLVIGHPIKRSGRYYILLAVLAAASWATTALAVYSAVRAIRTALLQPELWTRATGIVCRRLRRRQ